MVRGGGGDGRSVPRRRSAGRGHAGFDGDVEVRHLLAHAQPLVQRDGRPVFGAGVEAADAGSEGE
jgi:hypothetical protein